MSETPTRPARPPRQQRSVAPGSKAAGGKATAAAAEEVAEDTGKKGKKKKLIIGVVLLVVAAAAAYFLVFNKKDASAAEKKPEAGTVVALDSTSVNLAGGHYLRIGMALQMTKEGSGGEGDEPDGSKAKDLMIAELSGQSVDTLNNAKKRQHLKDELKEKVIKAYDEKVMDIYFTEFVTQ